MEEKEMTETETDAMLEAEHTKAMRETHKFRARGTDAARVIQVIETRSIRGSGTMDDLCRPIRQYWDFDGNLLAENDPCQGVTEATIIPLDDVPHALSHL